MYSPHALQTSDDFSGRKFGLQWQWHANPRDEWYSFTRRGYLRLNSIPSTQNLWTAPNLLMQKLPSRRFTVTTLIDASGLRAGQRSGLVIMGRNYSYIAVTDDSRLVHVVSIDAAKGTADKDVIIRELNNKSVFLRVSVNDGICEFSYSLDGKTFTQAGEPFTAKPGVWIGAKVGLFAVGSGPGHADYNWFRFEPLVRAPAEQSAQTPVRAR